jgi:stage II sporulation SpoE-like protein
MIYNEAFVPLIADKHPSALGAPAREVFPEAWDTIGPMMEGVRRGHGATWVEDAAIPLRRHGRLEECYFTFSYSAVRDGDGPIEGVLDIATETTREVLDRRRLSLLARLSAVLAEVENPREVVAVALPVLRSAVADLPSVEIALEDDDVAVDGSTVTLPIGTGQGRLIVRTGDHQVPDGTYLEFLRLIAASLGQALDRAAVHEAQRGLSEALQRSLLGEPPTHPGLSIAVRYRPAAERAQIGGDWYDAFPLPDGRLTIVVGDVTGHDASAAAAMAQVRNLVRGVAYTLQSSPTAVLAGVDEAMAGLGIDVFATAVLAQVHDGEDGARSLRWCNAGHLPPILLTPDGGARPLETTPDLLLGISATDRTDHAVAVEPGASVVIYTDGLIERRDTSLTESVRWLTGVLEGQVGRTAEQLADHIVGQLDDAVEDDVALLVLRADGLP